MMPHLNAKEQKRKAERKVAKKLGATSEAYARRKASIQNRVRKTEENQKAASLAAKQRKEQKV